MTGCCVVLLSTMWPSHVYRLMNRLAREVNGIEFAGLLYGRLIAAGIHRAPSVTSLPANRS